MKTMFALAAVLSVAAVAPTLTDLGAARSLRRQVILVEANGPTPNGRDTAVLAEANGPTPNGRDTAMLAEASGPSSNGRDTALTV